VSPAAFAQLVDELWEKHGHPDRHGYRDFMHPDGFEAACEELRDRLEADAAK
jgi:hypothetical protein